MPDEPKFSSGDGARGQFPITHWTVVLSQAVAKTATRPQEMEKELRHWRQVQTQ